VRLIEAALWGVLLLQAATLERQARQAYQRREWATAARLYEAFHTAAAGTASTFDNLGVALTNLGQWTRAEAAFRKAIDIDPKHRWAYNHLGYIYREAGRYEQAILMFRRQIELSPQDPYAYRNLASALVLTGHLDEAERMAATEEKITYERGEVYLDMACDLNGQNQPDQARKYLDMARAAGAERGLLAQETAHYLLTLGDYRAAEQQYLKLLEYQPYEPLVALRLGTLYWQTGNLEKAAATFDRVIRVDDHGQVTIQTSANTSKTVTLSELRADPAAGPAVLGDMPLDLGRAALLVDLNRHRRAFQESKSPVVAGRLRAACEDLLSRKNPSQAEGSLRDILGWTHFQQGRMTSAREEMERARMLSPRSRMIAYHFGAVLAQQGELQTALEVYTLSLGPIPRTEIDCGCEQPDEASREKIARELYAKINGDVSGFDAFRLSVEQAGQPSAR
jgi:tetratricopeptide (TPR) repeat protein